MHIVHKLIRIIVRTRSIVFLFIILLFINGWIYFYYPQNKFKQDVSEIKNLYKRNIDFISEIIDDHSNDKIITLDHLISYLKLNPDFRYIAALTSGKHTVYPEGLISFGDIESMPIHNINSMSDQQVLSFRLKPSLKHDYDFDIYYLGVDAGTVLDKQRHHYRDAYLIIILSVFLFLIFIVLYFIDLYRPSGQLHTLYTDKDYKIREKDESILTDKGILQLKSHLVNRKRELKSFNNILAATIKSQRNFIKVISHDLKAPLRNVSGLVDSINRKYSESLNPDISNRLDRIKKNVENEKQLISDILRNITSQKKILAYERVDVHNMINLILSDLDFEIQDKNINVQIENKLPLIYSNQIILRHVFQNLLDNACKYFPENGKNHIKISCKNNATEHVFSIKDNGPGISKEVQRTLFHTYDFSQSNSVVNTPESGLGLQLVTTFIEIINGKIWLESKVGKGSTFYISLNKLDDIKAGIFQ